MLTRKESMESGGMDGYHNFIGDDDEYKDWLIVAGKHRDSGVLECSNFDVALEMIGGESDYFRVERYGHWAVGWVEEIYVKPGSPAERAACEIEQMLEEYPILSEEDYCEREWQWASDVWAGLSIPDRIYYIKKYAPEISVLAARRNSPPEDCDDLLHVLTE